MTSRTLKYVLLVVFVFGFYQMSTAQKKGINPVPGYRKILEERFRGNGTWFQNFYENMDRVVGASLSAKRPMIIPLLQVTPTNDTTIVFCLTKDVQKAFGNKPARFI